MTRPLISAATLDDLLAAGGRTRVLDLRYYLGQPGRGKDEYRQGHIPGAVFVDLEDVFAAHPAAGGVGGRHPLPSLAALQDGLRAAGVNDGDSIVLADQGNQMGAARAWWVLRNIGLSGVRVLDGGLAAWQAAGFPISTEVCEVRPGNITVGQEGQMPQVVADDIPALVAAGHQCVDVRAAARFRGETEPIDPVAGHIPGAVNLPAEHLDAPVGLLPADQLAEVLADLRPGDVVSCGSGVTASKVILAAEQAGITGLRLYPGSWSDWISDPRRPVDTGRA